MTIEQSKTHRGFRYEVVAHPAGHRCGYVRIPKTHPLYGLSYSDAAPGVKPEDIESEEVGGRGIISLMCYDPDAGTVPLDVLFDVHGSITFGEEKRGLRLKSVSRGWWIGFDCAHDGDGRDPEIMGDTEREFASRHDWFTEGRIWTTEEVASECRRLIDQIRQRYP